MQRTVPILVTILVASASWVFFKSFTVTGIDQVRVEPKQPAGGSEHLVSDSTARRLGGRVGRESSESVDDEDATPAGRIRVATFHLQSLNESRLADPQLREMLASILRQFDVVALQNIRSSSDSVLPTLVQELNRGGRQFDGAIGPRVGPRDAEQQYAFVFNRSTLELDREELYTVDDRSGVLTYEPLVAWFRAVGPSADEAFTFSLVSLRLDEATAIQEQELLDDLLLAVKNDGRDEDDVIVAGTLHGGRSEIGTLRDWPGIHFVVNSQPTNVLSTATLDNLVFHSSSTREFTGKSGVLDFLRRFNLTLEQAQTVSDHLVVWAEFSAYEGGEARRMARAPR
jgi:hypothetical protein